MAWTTDDLVTAVQRSGWLPTASDIAATDLLAWGDECISEDFLELAKSGREEVGVTYTDVAIVIGTVRYRLPRRATFRTVRGITHVDSAGSESPAEEVPALEVWRYTGSRFGQAACTYRFEGDEIVLSVTPTTSGESLRIRYVMRPSRMVAVSDGARITGAVDTETLDVTSVPAWLTATSPVAPAYLDIVRGDSPFPTLYADLLGGETTSQVILDSSTPIVVAAIASDDITHDRRDYVCRRDETVYPPLPSEMHSALSWGIVSRALEALGDQRHAQAQARYARSLARIRDISEPRNSDRKPRIVDQGGRLRGGRMRSWR